MEGGFAVSTPDTRLVPMTREQRDYLLVNPATAVDRALAKAYDIAPDPAEAVTHEIVEYFWPQCTPDECDEIVREVLAALGCVSARETNEKPNA